MASPIAIMGIIIIGVCRQPLKKIIEIKRKK